MSMLQHLTKEQQQIAPLFNGAFIENKPIPFPDRGLSSSYSNLFYWAHLVAHKTAEFPLHAHEGFEIITFVFKGSLEHYDTATQIWTPLEAGGIQLIQAGSGVQHAERITKGSELFQIWFDPDFSKTLQKPASYKDYSSKYFKYEQEKGLKRLTYISEDSSVYFETPGLTIEKLSLDIGKHQENLDEQSTYSYYLLKGEIKIDGRLMEKDSFIVFNAMQSLNFNVLQEAELFSIKTSSSIRYKRFIERYKS